MTQRDDTQLLLQKAVAFHQRGQIADAQQSYEQVLASDPNQVDALHLLGVLNAQRGENDKALRLISEALKLAPNAPIILMNHGNALNVLGRSQEAVASFDKAVALQPHYVEAWINRGNTLLGLGQSAAAVESYGRALAINPNLFDILRICAKTLHDLLRYDEAVAYYQRALALKSNDVDTLYSLAFLLAFQGQVDSAVPLFDRVLTLRPNWATARFARCTAELPIIYADEQEISRRRSRYRSQLQRLSQDADQLASLNQSEDDFEAKPPYFLPYQGLNDRDLQVLFGSAASRIMSQQAPSAKCQTGHAAPGERIRVGIVSGYFHWHSVWKAPISGWVSQLDRGNFQLLGYYTGAKQDAETARAGAMFDQFVQGPLSLTAWREAILNDAPHVLIYPEIGMDPTVPKLAALRLAPIQCNSWGHPETSGYPTMDYFLSSDLMEPSDATDHYSEQLVRLPNLSIYYEPTASPTKFAVSRQDIGLRPSAILFWCCQTLCKYLPQYDSVFPRIAREIPNCQFAFIRLSESSHATDLFRKRLDGAFSSFGLKSTDYCVMLPTMPYHQFVAAMGLSDIFLDSMGWSGCNTTLESMIHDLPIVTMMGRLMRGRHSAAILKMMGITETVTVTVEDYVTAAVRLARDKAWRDSMKRQISINKHRLYRDRRCITALEDFLDGAARVSSPTVS